MGGGLLQLVAYGAQDVYLTGNPQITFFKVVYRRHTNFAIEAVEQSFSGNNNFGSSVSVLITRNGDLIHKIYFNAVLKNDNSKIIKNTSISSTPYSKDVKMCLLFVGRKETNRVIFQPIFMTFIVFG
jgi:hypothetical protein